MGGKLVGLGGGEVEWLRRMMVVAVRTAIQVYLLAGIQVYNIK